ncbi:hypothetical protein FTX45_09900 [Leclercia adecarboxylata]|uniref:hypothetical protein n=1 Tax=Leclercia adecarboxylata TaxID=83655 RepID=UPI001244BA66|nr:hypothetical protein [Leclercia adecarboxylata]QEY55129.1 hypothetical protein FTX45_09900 [Leclercia adecarboxylata]
MAEFTKERLQEIAEDGFLKHGEAKAMARQLLAGLEQEPVYQACKEAGVWVDIEPGDVGSLKANGEQVREVYAAPQLPQPAVVPTFDEWSRKCDLQLELCDSELREKARYIWDEACRTAMLQGNHRDLSHPVDPQVAEYEKIMERAMPDEWVAVPVDMAPAMMRAVQLNSELGAYAAANLTGAYSLFREFWDVAIAAAPQQEAEPVQAAPEGWVPCSPEWIERNGPCSCAEAPRIAFGSIGNHYHPHIYHNPKHEERP